MYYFDVDVLVLPIHIIQIVPSLRVRVFPSASYQPSIMAAFLDLSPVHYPECCRMVTDGGQGDKASIVWG